MAETAATLLDRLNDRSDSVAWRRLVDLYAFLMMPSLSASPTSRSSGTAACQAGCCPRVGAKIPPDLAVEVVSPNDTAYEVDEKLEDYRSVDVPLVWVINPNSRTVKIHRGDGSVSYLHEADELSGENVIPGFQRPATECSSTRILFRSDRGCGRRRVGLVITCRLAQANAIVSRRTVMSRKLEGSVPPHR